MLMFDFIDQTLDMEIMNLELYILKVKKKKTVQGEGEGKE